MSIADSYFMSLVPLLGAVFAGGVFSLLMYACIRNVDREKMRVAQDEWWNADESVVDRSVREPPS